MLLCVIQVIDVQDLFDVKDNFNLPVMLHIFQEIILTIGRVNHLKTKIIKRLSKMLIRLHYPIQ